MRLLYFHTRDRDSGPEGFATEGIHCLFEQMANARVLDYIAVLIESFRIQAVTQYQPNYSCRTIDAVSTGLLRAGDVVFIRGGFKPWLPFIDYCRQNKIWLLFYGANTGRERWPFWDIVFDDLSGVDRRFDPAGRVYLDWPKPIHPDLFYYEPAPVKYDVCIGASHIHDKKGQWRGVDIARKYKLKFGSDLKCVMPGSLRGGERTRRMLDRLPGLQIDMPGMVSRKDLAGIFRQSRLFLHLGTGGQGDRGPLEAMACGCQVLIGYPGYHSPHVSSAPAGKVAADPDDFEKVADMIHAMLQADIQEKRIEVARCFLSHFAIDTVLLPRMRRLVSFLKAHPAADRKALVGLKWGC